MLVVISTVGLLVAILSPTLASARQQAQQVVCAARLRQWGVAFDCYASQNDDSYPHCDGLDRGPRKLDDPRITKEDVADWHGWVDVIPPLIHHPPWREYSSDAHPDPTTFYQCPSGRPSQAAGMYAYRPFRDGYFSYAMNSCLELDFNAWAPPGGVDYPMPSFLKTTRIVCPPRVILLFDQLLDPRAGFDGHKIYRSAGKHCGSYPKSFAVRHRRGRQGLGGNILHSDGHVIWRRSVWKPQWDAELEVPPRGSAEWFPYPPAVPEGAG
ncbi:MAG: hypothetical protein C4523_19985 [Myxococcales bacterium]|nr:MAG: hypothetical protein C4523_19985 [Myxococcales bacterium]